MQIQHARNQINIKNNLKDKQNQRSGSSQNSRNFVSQSSHNLFTNNLPINEIDNIDK